MSTERAGRTETERRAHAVRVVAGVARDADDLRDLLGMLGLDPAEARPAAGRPVERPAPVVPAQQRHQGVPMTDLAAMLAAADVHHRPVH